MKMLFTRLTTRSQRQQQHQQQKKKSRKWKEKLSWLTFLSYSFSFLLMLSKEASEYYLLIKLKVMTLETCSVLRNL